MPSRDNLLAEAQLTAKRARELGLTQAHIAQALQISQSQVSRILSGRARRRSRLFADICKYVHDSGMANSDAALGQAQEIHDALKVVWDGTPEHARALAVVIRSLGALHPSARASDPPPARR